MVSDNHYRYTAEFLSSTGKSVGSISLAPDWTPAVEWSHLEGIRQCSIPAYAQPSPAEVLPVWDKDLGAPYISQLRVQFCGGESNGFRCDIPVGYFNEPVQHHSSRLVESGKLAAGEQFSYRVCAYKVTMPDQAQHRDANPLNVEVVPKQMEISPSSLEPLIESGKRHGDTVWHNGDFPVFVPQAVLDEAEFRATQAGDLESGGILVGKLYRDADGNEVFLRITAQIPAKHTVATQTSLKFTGETWAAAAAAIKLRGRNEQICGWHHSHPWFCRKCPAESQRVCRLAKKPFFSGDDCTVHRTVFSQAYHVALLLSFLGPEKLSIDCFGWREGLIKPRGFIVPSNTES